jgi:hypothetical protein
VKVYYSVMAAVGLAGIIGVDWEGAIPGWAAGPMVGVSVGTLWAGCVIVRRRR